MIYYTIIGVVVFVVCAYDMLKACEERKVGFDVYLIVAFMVVLFWPIIVSIEISKRLKRI